MPTATPSEFSDLIDDGLLELQSDMTGTDEDGEAAPVTFIWRPDTGPVEVICVPNMAVRGTVLIIGGREVTVQFSLNVRVAYFLTVDSTLVTVDSELYTSDNDTPRPVAGMFLQFRGRDYRIFSAGLDATGVYFNLVCVDRQSAR